MREGEQGVTISSSSVSHQPLSLQLLKPLVIDNLQRYLTRANEFVGGYWIFRIFVIKVHDGLRVKNPVNLKSVFKNIFARALSPQ